MRLAEEGPVEAEWVDRGSLLLRWEEVVGKNSQCQNEDDLQLLCNPLRP